MPGSSKANVPTYSPAARGSKTLDVRLLARRWAKATRSTVAFSTGLPARSRTVQVTLRWFVPVSGWPTSSLDRPAQAAVLALLLGRLLVVQALLIPVGLDGKRTDPAWRR